MPLPNFLIIGPGRTGTTSLYYYLKQHPEIYMSPIKETNFFAYEQGKPGRSQISKRYNIFPIKNIEAYSALFKAVTKEKAIGEASPRYFFTPQAAERIKLILPEVKLIAILRDPVERAFSSYLRRNRDGFETRTFPQAIQDDKQNTSNDYLFRQAPYWRTGFYHRHL